MDLNNIKFNKIPPIPSNIISLNKIPNGVDKMLLSNIKPPNSKCTKLNYYNYSKYLKYFNNKNNDKYLNLVNTQNLPTILQNTVNSNFTRGNVFSSGFYPDDNKSCTTINTPRKSEEYKIYNNTNDPHYPVPNHVNVHNKNFKIYPNQNKYLRKYPYFNIPYYEHYSEVNYKSQFFQLLIYLSVIIIIIYLLSCINLFNNYSHGNNNNNKLKIRKKQNIKYNFITLGIIGIICILLYMIIKGLMKNLDVVLSPNCSSNPEYDNKLIKECNITKTSNLNTNCNNCKTISNENILNKKTSCLFGGKEVGGDKECQIYSQNTENNKSNYAVDMIFPIYFLCLLIGTNLILLGRNPYESLYITSIFNFCIIGIVFIISYYLLGNDEAKKQFGWQLGIGGIELVFYIITSYILFNYLFNALQ